MKKLFITLIIFLIFFSLLCSCGSKKQTNEERLYFAKDVTTFLHDWNIAQLSDKKGEYDILIEMPHENALIIPEINTDEYKLSSIEANKYTYIFTFKKNVVETYKYYEPVCVNISRQSNSYEVGLKQLNLIDDSGVAYDKDKNNWFINNNGSGIVIYLPKEIAINSRKELFDFINFEFWDIDSNGNIVKVPKNIIDE